jgi:hypothetical protein
MLSQPLERLPLWAVYLVILALTAAAVAGGYWYVRARYRGEPPKSDGGLTAISGATLGLLAFLLAFVLGFGVNVTQERRALVVADANALRASYLRAGYIPEPYKTQARALLSEEVDLRVAAIDKQKIADALARTEQIHNELWKVTEDLVAAGNTSDVTALYVESVNEVISTYVQRANMAINIRTPPMIILATLIFTLLAVFLVGMQMGYAKGGNLIALFVLVVVLSAVLYLIFDLDRAQEGLLRVPQRLINDLQAQLPSLP